MALSGFDTAPTVPSGPDDEGVAKLWVTATALRLRRDRPELFEAYAPLVATGDAESFATLARRFLGPEVAVVEPAASLR